MDRDYIKEHERAESKRNWTNLSIIVLTWIIPLTISTLLMTSNQRMIMKKIDTMSSSRSLDTTWKIDVDTVYMNKATEADSIVVTTRYFKLKPDKRPK